MRGNVKSDNDMEEKIWVRIPKKSGTWKGINPGDELIGTYLKKLPDSFRGTPKTKYCFETEHPQAVDGKLVVYGTEGINNQLEDELIGCKLKITFKGTQPTADPKKKAFKIYDIEAFIAPSHPKYNEYTNETKESKSPGKAQLADADDREAQNTIENYEDIYKSNNHEKEPKPQDIINIAETDPNLSDVKLSRIKVQLAHNIKKIGAV